MNNSFIHNPISFPLSRSLFLLLCLLLWIGLGIALLTVDKLTLHLWLNSCHTPWQDRFFPIATKLGEWIPYAVAACLLFYKIGWSVFLLVDIWVSGLMGQLFKHLINAPRPITWLASNYPDIHFPLVEGVTMNQALSFPSGHTISCFALFTTLSILLTEHIAAHQNQQKATTSTLPHTSESAFLPSTFYLLPIVCFLLATTGSYSRIYLSQHFTLDIWAGMFIGILTTLLLYPLFARFIEQKWFNLHFFAKK